MKAGDKTKIHCNECETETEITFIKGEGNGEEVSTCPICGSDQFEVVLE